MYKFLCDEKLLHDYDVEELKILSPQIDLEQNEIDSFKFTIYPTNPRIKDIHKLSSIIKVYQDNDLIFRGRPYETEKGTKNSLIVYCESHLAFLCDSVQEPFEYQGSVQGLLEMFINRHNEQVLDTQKFKLGRVTVTDPNDYITRSNKNYSDTWTAIKEKLIKLLGGYIHIRAEKDGYYIDYLEDLTTLNNQAIEFGKNLLTVKRNEDCREIATVLIPLGAENKETGSRLTIESVNGGKKYIESQTALDYYGKRITKVVAFDDVTLAENLLRKGKQALAEMDKLLESIEINAIDMASVQKDITNFKINAKIHVKSVFHKIDDYFVPLKMAIYPFSASKNKITLNSTKKSLTESENSTESGYGSIVDKVETIIKDNQINVPIQIQSQLENLRNELTTLINQSATSIKQEVSENYYAVGANDVLAQMSTMLEQTKNSFLFSFNEFSQNIEELTNNTNAEFESIKTYFKIESDGVTFGDDVNGYYIKITKNAVEFYSNGNKIGYVSVDKLELTSAEIKTLKIGNILFSQRTNGNLSIKVV